MKDQEKTKEQLITELVLLRQRVAESEKARGASTDVAELRHRTEERLTAKQAETDKPRTETMERLVHDLQVHQIELELQRTQRDHEVSQSKYSDLYDFSPVGYLTLKGNGFILEANLTLAGLVGVERGHLIESPFQKYMLIEDADKFCLHLNNVFENKEHLTCEVRLVTKGGGDLWVMLDSILVQDAHGKELCRTSVVDITERKRMEEALRKSEERLRLTLEAINDGVWDWNIPTGTAVFSPRWYTMLGYEAYESLQNYDSWRSLVHPDDIVRIEREINKHIASGEGYAIEIRMRTKSDGWRWILTRGMVVERDADGRPIRMVGTHSDITERKRSEEALKESEASYRALAENLPGIVYRLFPDESRMLFFNDMLQSVTGYRSEELTSQGFCCIEPLILSGDRDEVIDAVRAAVNERKPFEVAYRLRHKNGSIRNCLERGRPIYDEGGEFLHIEGVILDTTERIRIENQLRQAQKMEAIGTLAGGIAHDFNNILATILTYSQIALRDLSDSNPAHGDLQQVVQSTLRAKDLVKQILAFSRQTDTEKKHPLRVGSIIKEAIQLLRASLPSTVEIRQRIMSKEDVALIDPTQIHQVLVNLCTNAAHAMHEKGGVLDVSLTKVKLDACDVISCPDLKAGHYLKLSVSDTGQGMDPDTLQQIFDPYFTTKEPGEGTGLGLAVVHGIVKGHDGAIRVHSEAGKGSTFDVLFPVIESSPETNLENDMDMPGGTERILLIDDEEALLMGGKRVFEKLGYHVVAKKNGLEALEVFQAQPYHFDLVITDYTMPHMTGLDIAREIMRIRPDIPIVLSTGGGAADTLEKAKEAGIREIVTKPLHLCDLARIARRALDKVQSDDLSGQRSK